MVDLDPCLTKKPLEDSACHPYNTRGSMSEVQSLSSFQSESCDDNGELQHHPELLLTFDLCQWFSANTVSLHAELDALKWRLRRSPVLFLFPFCYGASAPIWIKSVHRSRTRF